MDTQEKPASKRPASNDGGCRIEIRITSQGDVNIYNCSSPCKGDKPASPKDDCLCPPTAPGACVPASPGHKPKQSRRQKLDKLLAGKPVPSALAAGFFQMARRQLAGHTPANALEQRAFTKMKGLSPDLRRILACACDSFDDVSNGEREKLFATGLLGDLAQPLDIPRLTDAFADEVASIVGLQVFGDAGCAITEHPGQVRTQPHPGGEFPPAQVRVCRINDLRTGTFLPPLTAGDWTPAELQQSCHVIDENGVPKQVCEVQTTNCPGTTVDGGCLRVQEVEAGKAVLLEGVNFCSIDTRVRITDVATFSIVRDVDAHVCGDDETPRTESVAGNEVIINDCRVHDRLSFRLPDDLPPGLYDFQVMVPNVGAVAGWGETLFSDGHRIAVVPPATARFQIASESLHARAETAPASWGSDEVGIKILGVALFPDLSAGPPQAPNGGNPIRFGDVDSGEHRSMDHILFAHQQPIIGGVVSILGYEVDGEDAFEQQIEGFTDAFVDILKDELQFILDHFKEASAIAGALAKFGWAGAIAAAIALAVVLAIDLIVALWAPADLIIEDAIGPTIGDLVALTSVNFPLPPPSEHITPGGIRVKVTPLEKAPNQYRERREYISDDEESRYEIVYRYNRLA